jgi:hypothetical protein
VPAGLDRENEKFRTPAGGKYCPPLEKQKSSISIYKIDVAEFLIVLIHEDKYCSVNGARASRHICMDRASVTM